MKDYMILIASDYQQEFDEELQDLVMSDLGDRALDVLEDLDIAEVLRNYEEGRYNKLFQEYLHEKKMDLMEDNPTLNFVDVDWDI